MAQGEQMTGSVTIRVLWEPIFLLGRPPVVLFDGAGQPTKPLNAGIDLSIMTTPGRHTLVIRMPLLLGLTRGRRYVVETPTAGEYLVRLHYSRIWGNFRRKADISFQPVSN